MSSPVIYAKPKRGVVYRNTVNFYKVKGGRVYAPASGKVKQEGKDVVVKQKDGRKHTLTNVKLRKSKSGKSVSSGAWIGKAVKSKVKYKVFGSNGKQKDAMKVVQKKDGKQPKWMNVKKVLGATIGEMNGGGNERKVVWHTTESGNSESAIDGVANYIVSKDISYHILYNPWTGQFRQMYAADVPARSVGNAYNPYMANNRHGEICIQVSIVGKASQKPLDGGSPMKNRRKLMQFLDQWEIPRKNISDTKNHSRSQWVKSGHTTHGSAPDNWDRTDPGPVNWSKLLAP